MIDDSVMMALYFICLYVYEPPWCNRCFKKNVSYIKPCYTLQTDGNILPRKTPICNGSPHICNVLLLPEKNKMLDKNNTHIACQRKSSILLDLSWAKRIRADTTITNLQDSSKSHIIVAVASCLIVIGFVGLSAYAFWMKKNTIGYKRAQF